MEEMSGLKPEIYINNIKIPGERTYLLLRNIHKLYSKNKKAVSNKTINLFIPSQLRFERLMKKTKNQGWHWWL